MNRNIRLWPTITSISTKRTITEKDTTCKRICSEHTQSQKIVNQRIINMPSQGGQAWLRSLMSSQGSQTCLRSPMSRQGSQINLAKDTYVKSGTQTWLRTPMSSQGSQA
jgi:hypothetical protein